ncbi:Ubiquitin fusion degradation protein 4 [Agyrium rufum]|nr:Ubiquitin fusion degradation protein 4 [Agyrium rufum]
MSSRVTRSAARLAAGSKAVVAAAPQPPAPEPTPSGSRKRKAPKREPSPEASASTSTRPPTTRRTKRQKVQDPVEEQEPTFLPPPPPPPSRSTTARSHRRKENQTSIMSTPGSSELRAESPVSGKPSSTSAKRSAGRYKKTGRGSDMKLTCPSPEVDVFAGASPSLPSSSTRSRRVHSPHEKEEADTEQQIDAIETEAKNTEGQEANGKVDDEDSDDDGGDEPNPYDQMDDEDGFDPFRSGFLGRTGSGPGGLSSTLRALSGMVTGASSRLRGILENLRKKEDPSVQLIALQELSEILLVSTEDTLAGHFASDQFVKELVQLMKTSDFEEENPEMMLLACRCIANLMEALPPATANVVYGGAVPILCQKLLEIQFIDLAEQALSTLEKISTEFPASIVREGGLTACLTYLDFFATSTQRTAVTTAANCCRNLPEDSFATVRDVMPILLNVLKSNDQKVVEQGSLCVSRIVESFRYSEKLEELISQDLLQAILRLLVPGTTNLISAKIHTQFLRVLSITARASPKLSAALLKMKIIDTLYQILTGVSPPTDTEDPASQIDGVVIMQALIHRPKEQIFETLNVICELLPGISTSGLAVRKDLVEAGCTTEDLLPIAKSRSKNSPDARRKEILAGCKDELRRFAMVLIPTLTHAYSSTVNLNVRQKVLTAQLKMFSNLDTTILENALRLVPYASYLASILSQQDHPMLVMFALQAAELLLVRLESIYRYQFYREGVMAEISKLASQTKKTSVTKAIKEEPDVNESLGMESKVKSEPQDDQDVADAEPQITNDVDDDDAEDDNVEHEDDGDDDDNERVIENEDEDVDEVHEGNIVSASVSSSSSSSDDDYVASSPPSDLQSYVARAAKKIMDIHENGEKGKAMREKASQILEEVQVLAKSIRTCFLGKGTQDPADLFQSLSGYFNGNALESITSFELLNSDIVQILLDVLTNQDDNARMTAQATFLKVFMETNVRESTKLSTSAFGILVHKLQDLFSRAEHFEVVTVHHNAFESNRNNAASMLAKQIRLKLIADDDSSIPAGYRHIMVSIHAIATFKALDDYLRPRISFSDKPRSGRHHEGVSSALAAFAAAAGLPNAHQRLADRGFLATGTPSSLPMPSASHTTSKPQRKSSSTTETATGAATPPASAPSKEHERPSSSRRSSRRHQAARQDTPSTPAPNPPPEMAEEALECADEQQLVDEDDLDGDGTLDAYVDDLEDELENEHIPDPSAVNMEVAATGKVTARQEDGTRVPTPSQATSNGPHGPPQTRSRANGPIPTTPSSLGRTMSYAAAIQSVPQDWHMEFSINDQPISNETTIYRAVHQIGSTGDESSRNIWSAMHTIKMKKVSGPPPPEPSSLTPPPDSSPRSPTTGMPASLQNQPVTSGVLQLLGVLHQLNANIQDIMGDKLGSINVGGEPLSQFVNTKLTAKLNRQLEEPLIVASNCLPTWSEDLARHYPFLFPFETRHLFLQSTSFGYSRSMSRWQNAQSTDDSRRDRHRDERPFLGRLQRQKVRISRTRILESAVKVMELYGASPSVLEVEYFEEVGTGLGPTLEFYSTVSREFSKKKTKMWRENESIEYDQYAFGKNGLFPAPMSEEQASSENGQKALNLFKMLGKFVARSMLDSRIIDISFNPMFFRSGDAHDAVPSSLELVKNVDSNLAASLRHLKLYADLHKTNSTRTTRRRSQVETVINGVAVEDMSLDFTLPGYPHIELVDNGTNTSVTSENVQLYIEKVIDLTLGAGVRRQIDAFRAGFSQVFPYSALKAFTPSELVMLFGRVEEDWTIETLMDSIKADHGFNMDSKSVRNLLQTMSELTPAQRRDFLQFVTGSPKLPIGGFKSLTPMFTVVCKPSEPPYTSDDYLPSVMTCVNYLKLPDYTDLEVLRKRLYTAIREGQGAFHLS